MATPTNYVRFIKIARVPMWEGESTRDAIERADMLDNDGSLEYELLTTIVDADDNVLEET